MFEQYIHQPNRKSGNIELLKNYQQDIDAISCIFDERTLFSLMTEFDVNGHRVMKHIHQAINIFSPTSINSNQINIFQDTDNLLRWVHKFSLEAKHVMLDIYANRTKNSTKSSTRCNRLPKKDVAQLESFIQDTLKSAVQSGTPKTVYYFIDTLSHLPLCYIGVGIKKYDGRAIMLRHVKTLNIYTKKTSDFLCSSSWLKSLPKHKKLTPDVMSKLIFAYFCAYFLEDSIALAIKQMKTNRVIGADGYINHPKLIKIITLTMTFYEVLNQFSFEDRYKNTLTPPDRFIFNLLKKHNVANFTGIGKTQEQLIRKTYIYLALLLNPEWEPSAKAILKLLSGEHSSIPGKLDFNSTSLALETQINSVSLMSNERYFENFLAAFAS
ncbi:hypothetical protein F8538_09615 [Edwardsiella ictaluri]|uniref:hypothetical protein n=1 Tax=Edwardsiella ictaluri TaxID=67780 RepID=UPI0009BE5A34|nr:hypothetical protein [Edwardsiella ictaluri]ARD38606.1 hypothetical protein B6E78_03665 [Edwardsiella ictaluri]QPW27027.1 hypothetical protein F8538_09615 [Edwardsiella ictaluri]